MVLQTVAGWLDGCGVMLTSSAHSYQSSHFSLMLIVVVDVVVVVVSYELKLSRRFCDIYYLESVFTMTELHLSIGLLTNQNQNFAFLP